MKADYYIGIDIGSEEYVAGLYQPERKDRPTESFPNSEEGFEAFEQWLQARGVTPENSVLCMESTGVYGEALSYHLAVHQWRIAVEAPQKVKRGMHKHVKNDRVDARQIAEYAYRYSDELAVWQIPEATLKHIETLLATRRHCMKQRNTIINRLKALRRQVFRTSAAEVIMEQQLDLIDKQLAELDKELKREVKSNPDFREKTALALSVPGIGDMMALHLLVITKGFREHLNHKQLSSHLGICPYEYSSGTSVFRPARARKKGPKECRKNLYLASMSVTRNNAYFRQYFLDKKAQHKPGRLILNNIGNKILKILCAVMNSRTKFNPHHISRSPIIQYS